MTDSVTQCIAIAPSGLASVQLHNSCAITQFQHRVHCTLDTVSTHICPGQQPSCVLVADSDFPVACCINRLLICS